MSCFLQDVIENVLAKAEPDPIERPWEADWRRLSVYTAARRLMNTAASPFSLSDLRKDGDSDVEADLERFLAALLRVGFVELRDGGGSAGEASYTVARKVRSRLGEDGPQPFHMATVLGSDQ